MKFTPMAALLALVLLAACSSTSGVATIDGGDVATPTPSASAGSDDPEEAMFAFAECMREQGIDMPDPVIRRFEASGDSGGGIVNGGRDEAPGGGPAFDPNSEEFQAAEEICGEHLEGLEGLEPGDAPELTPEQEEALIAFTECMREHGIDMPDPGAGAIRIGPGSDTDFDPNSEEFRAAQEECRSHLDGVRGPENQGASS
jgi:hypothetical protein